MPETPKPSTTPVAPVAPMHPKQTTNERKAHMERQLDFFLTKGPKYEVVFLRVLKSWSKMGIVDESKWMTRLNEMKRTDKRWARFGKRLNKMRIKRVPSVRIQEGPRNK